MFAMVTVKAGRPSKVSLNEAVHSHFAALTLSILLLVYHQVTTCVPLFPWNDVQKYSKREMFLEAGTNGLFMLIAVCCLATGNVGFSHWYPLIYFPILLLGECVDWWIPFFSETFAEKRKIWDYESKFERTLKFIPHKPGKRTPDANHTVLHLLTVFTLIVVFIDRLSVNP
jgi:hypothetical protein